MEASLKAVFASAGKLPERPSTRRRTQAARVACEALEGRQLLSIASGSSMMQFSHLTRGQGLPGVALRGQAGSFAVAPGGSGVFNVNPGGVINTIAPSTNADPGAATTASYTVVTPASTSDAADPNAAVPADAVGTAAEPINATTLPAPGFGLNTMPESAPGVLLATGLMGGSDNALGLIGGGSDAFTALGGAIQFKIAAQAAQGTTSSGDSGATTDSSGNSGTTTDASGDAAKATDPLQADFEKFNADFQAITDKSTVTPAMLATVRKDFEAIQAAATSAPDQDKLKTFATDVSNLNGTLPTADQTTQLEADFTAVLNSEGVTDQALISKAIADVHAVIQATNVTADDLATLAADQEAIKKDTPDQPWGSPVLFDAAAQSGVAGNASFSTEPVSVTSAPVTLSGTPANVTSAPVTLSGAPSGTPVSVTSAPAPVSTPNAAPTNTNFQVTSAVGGPSAGSFSDYTKGSPAVLSTTNFTGPAGVRSLAGRFSSGNFTFGGRTQGGKNGAGTVSSASSDGNGGLLYGVPKVLRGGSGVTGKFTIGRMNRRQGF